MGHRELGHKEGGQGTAETSEENGRGELWETDSRKKGGRGDGPEMGSEDRMVGREGKETVR